MSIDLPTRANAQQYAHHSPLRFVIGQNRDGQWLAMETHGLGGGLFRSREAAMRYAVFETDHRPDGVRVISEPIEFRL